MTKKYDALVYGVRSSLGAYPDNSYPLFIIKIKG